MDLKRIATIIGVALISYFGFYITVFVYNFIAILFASVDKGIHNKTTKYGLPTY